MAVGGYIDRRHVQHALAQIWNGSRWRVLANPAGVRLTSVSCSAPWFCMASGGPTGTERWNGRAWLEMRSPAHKVTAPSCGSRSQCMVINGTGKNGSGAVAESWNGRNWRTWFTATTVCSGIPGTEDCGLADVSCGSGNNCVAVGSAVIDQEGDQATFAVQWDGVGWRRIDGPPWAGNPVDANAVSCAGTFCMSVGSAFEEVDNGVLAEAGTWSTAAKSWTNVAPNLGVCTAQSLDCDWAKIISCGSAANCMAFTTRFGNLDWNGTTWTKAPAVSAGTGSSLSALSCRASMCMAVGHRTIAGVRRTLAELWNGTAWRILGTP